MYKIIIADDEKIIQDGIVKLVDWNSLGFEIAGVLDDGAEVIECLNSMPIDVVFTDVKMRHISGIDVARYIYNNEIPCKVVFLSGYKEFELVHQAIKYGVEDYILKPSKVEELKTVFQKIKKELDEKARTLEFYKKVDARWVEMKPMLKEQFINELVTGTLRDKNELRQRMQLLYPEIDVEANPCMIADIIIENYDSFMSEYWKYGMELFDDAFNNFIKIMDKECYCHVIFKNKEKFHIFIMAKTYKQTGEENIAFLKHLCEQVKEQVQEIFRVKVTYVPIQYYQSVVRMVKQPIVYGKLYAKEDMDLLLKEQKKLIMTNIMKGNINTAKKMLVNILSSLDKDNLGRKKNFIIDIFSSIGNFLQNNNNGLFLQVEPYLDYNVILNLDDLIQLTEYCEQFFDVMKSKEAISDHFDKDSLINRMKEYVDEHILEDINLENVADELFISSSQLNRILKKQTGETFLQLVTRRKMEKAIELLHDPQYKVYQVGEILGYKTARHFSKLFYNFCGYYPSQYRKDVLKIGD